MSQDGRRVAACAADGFVRVWNTIDGQEVSAFPVIPGVQRLFFTGDGTRLVVASREEGATYDVHTGKELSRLVGNTKHTVSVIPDPEGERFVTVSYLPDAVDATLRLWTTNGLVSDLGAVRSFLDPEAGFSSHRSAFFITGHGSTAAVRDAQSGQLREQLRRQRRATTALTISPDDRHLATGDMFGEIAIWELASGRLLRCWRAHEFFVVKVAYTRDGRFFLRSGGDGRLRLWEAEGTRELRTFELATNAAAYFDISPDGRRLATGFGNALRFWNLETGECERELPGHSELVYFVMYTQDGKPVMTTAMDQTLRIWDAASGRLLSSWKLRGDAYGFAISPDGKRVALRASQGVGCGMDAPTVELWDTESGQQLLSYRGFMERAAVIGFSPDGRRLVSDWWFADLRQWEAFPWRVADYPGAPGDALRNRLRLFARQYWQERLEAEMRMAITNSTVFVDLPRL